MTGRKGELTNALKRSIESGRLVLGVGAVTQSPIVVEIAGRLGLDFVWVDTEHGGISPEDGSSVESLVRAAEASGTTILLRTADGDRKVIQKVLDAGVHALLISDVGSADEVKRIVDSSRFSVEGSSGARGFSAARFSGWATPDPSMMKLVNADVLVGVMIESREAVEMIDRIVAVEGLGFVFVGPGDLSISLGVGGQTSHEKVTEALGSVVAACKRAGVPAGFPASDVDSARKAIAGGFTIVRCAMDTALLRKSLSQAVKELRAAPSS